jgi:hypothetical protein
VLFVGRAQEKTNLFRTEKRHNAHGDSYPWIVKTTGVVNQFYFYCLDADFGPLFLKSCSYFPYNAKLCINGNEWAKRQAAKSGVAFTALDNGSAAVDNPAALQTICDRLGPKQIDALLRKWLTILPHPFTADDEAAGYRYELSILQAEFSLTQMLDNPVSGRVFFEQVIRDNLDIGRPDQVSLIFDRQLQRRGPRATPGRFRTRVITAGVTPSLHVDYKHTAIKQYHKQRQALRTETTINHTRDFGIGKRLTNLPALREIGYTANRRLLGVQQLGHDPITGTDALAAITGTLTTATGARIPGLRFADQRTHALLSALLIGATCTASPTKTCAPTPPSCVDSTPPPSPPGRSPTTCADSNTVVSSPASQARTATASPIPGHREISHLCRTAYCAVAWPNSPPPPQPPRARCDPPSPHTAQQSKTSPPQHNSYTKYPPPQPHSNTNEPDPYITDLTRKSGFAGSSQLVCQLFQLTVLRR